MLPERGSEAGAGAGSGCAEACFSKNGRKRSVVGSVFIYIYINIYIFKRKHVECQTRCKIYETCMFVILPNLDWDTISLEMANGPSIVTIYVGVAFVDQWFNFFDSRQFFNISDIQFFIFDCICEGSTIYNLYLDFLTYSWFARCSGCLFVDKWKRASCMCNLHKHKKIQHKHGLTTTKTPK